MVTHLGLEAKPGRVLPEPHSLGVPTNDPLNCATAVGKPDAVGENSGRSAIARSSGWLFPPLYPQVQSDGQPDLNAAHCIADTWYADDYYADPKNFDAAAEQAKFQGMSDDEIMASYMTSESAFLATQFDTSGKTTGWPLGGNTDPATGRPFNAGQV